MRIGFTIDTNIILSPQKNPPIQNSLRDFMDYIRDFLKAKPKDELKLVLSEVAVDEYLAQRKDYLRETYEKLRKNYDNLGDAITGALPLDKIDASVQNEKQYLPSNITVLKLKYTTNNFKSLVNDALNKNPPFDKSESGQKTDAGFKDALIWNTIMNSEEIDSYDIFYFASCDKIFENNKELLEKEFIKHHQKTKLIFLTPKPNGEQRQVILRKIIEDNHLLETTEVKLYDKTNLLRDIQHIEYNKTLFSSSFRLMGHECPESINFKGFNEESFVIEKIKKNDETYTVYVSFETDGYTLANTEATKIKLVGKIELNYEKSARTLKLIYSQIKDLYYLDLSTALLRIANTSMPKLDFENLSELLKPSFATSGTYQSLLRCLDDNSGGAS